MPSINLRSGPIHYREAGTGTPLLLLHANPGDSRDYDAVIPALGAAYRVLALDWPGCGQSPAPQPPESASVLRCCRVLHEFVDALKLPPAVVIGNSLGGNVAAHLAIERPQAVKALVLVSPAGFNSRNFASRLFCAVQGSRFSIPPGSFAKRYLRQRSAAALEMLERAAGPQSNPAGLAVNRAIWRSFADPVNDLRRAATTIRCPTLLVFGAHDPIVPAKKDGRTAARAIANSRLVTPAAGHAPFAEAPEAFLAEVLPFLADETRRGDS